MNNTRDLYEIQYGVLLSSPRRMVGWNGGLSLKTTTKTCLIRLAGWLALSWMLSFHFPPASFEIVGDNFLGGLTNPALLKVRPDEVHQSNLIPPINILGLGQFPENCACEKSNPGFYLFYYGRLKPRKHEALLLNISCRRIKLTLTLYRRRLSSDPPILPVPPPNTIKYSMYNNNRYTGDIPSTICYCTSLEVLDLSNNSMSGPIPLLAIFWKPLSPALVLQKNFSGTIPEPYPKECTLNVLDLSQNQLMGKVPKSLSNCKMIQILDLSDNQLEQTFPIWLGTIPRLKVLILHSNKFHGVIGSPRISSEFPLLRIIDLSHNYLTGDLPVKYFQIWNAMRISSPDTELYIETQVSYQNQNKDGSSTWNMFMHYPSSITLRNKGVKKNYEKILNIFTSIDLSSNKFTGHIRESFGSLEALQSLDLSNNELTGPIPPSIGNLKQLESLDLSHNKLSGVIPQQLASELNFLEFFNVSYNLLSGHIPRGQQFETFENTSYTMNSELCGFPLSKTCGTVQSLPADEDDEEENESVADEFRGGFIWVFILAGLGSGLVVGIVMGNIFVDRYPWLIAGAVQKLGWTLKNRRRQKRQNIGIRKPCRFAITVT